jgi:adenosylmethionine-8-amino-7-oxononanoate aminotransferase
MVGIELVADKDTKESFPPEERIGHRVIKEARKCGVIIRPLGDVIVLMPPLSISIDELDRLCDITYESIRVVTEKYN